MRNRKGAMKGIEVAFAAEDDFANLPLITGLKAAAKVSFALGRGKIACRAGNDDDPALLRTLRYLD